MIIRKNNPNETEAIIQLLRASLGESLLKKSAHIWSFKHEENVFGTSPVWVAEEEGALIGVRALMQWRWQLQDEVWVSYRAVDTATHPHHQGKGIFRTLTMRALEETQKKGESFVFNTPNEKSRPGYLKMGWQSVGKIRVALVPAFFYYFKGLFSAPCRSDNNITISQLEQICQAHNKNIATKNVLFTPKSASYLKWRYEDNPMQNYILVSTPDWYIAMYVKKHRFFNEMRVVEVIGDLDKNSKQLQQTIASYGLKNNCMLFTVADKNLFKLRVFGNFGPVLTFRSLGTLEHFNQKALQLENWCYSLGDLELF